MGFSLVERGIRKVGRDGIGESVKSAAGQVRQRVSFEETHFWFEMPLQGEEWEFTKMPGKARFAAGRPQDMHLIEQLPSIGVEGALERLEAGNHLWMAVLDGKPAFSCWTLYGYVPVMAAPGGRMPIPQDVVMIEDSVALPGLRNQGLARNTLSNVLTATQRMGFETIITRTLDENIPPQRLAVKLGMRKTASNYFRRSGIRTYRSTESSGTPVSDWISSHLGGRKPGGRGL